MPYHKIKSKQDIKDLQEIYENGAVFEDLKTGKFYCLSKLLRIFDKEITIQHI